MFVVSFVCSAVRELSKSDVSDPAAFACAIYRKRAFNPCPRSTTTTTHLDVDALHLAGQLQNLVLYLANLERVRCDPVSSPYASTE